MGEKVGAARGGVRYAEDMRKALLVACAWALGIVWGCSAFDTADSGSGSPDATAGEGGTDAPVSDAVGDAPPGVVANDGPVERGPQCAGRGTFCNAGELCCFRMSNKADSCVKLASDCQGDPDAGKAGAFVLRCSDSASCPASSPNCCLVFRDGNGSTCSALPCAPALQLCSGDPDCMGTGSCAVATSGLDDYYGECH